MTAVLIEAQQPRPVTVRPAPRREPPFDDELPSDRRLVALAGAGEPQLPFAPTHPSGPIRTPRSPATNPWATIHTAAHGELPDPSAWARRMLVALLEARAGLRPIRQLAACFSPSVHAGLVGDFTRAAARISTPAANPAATLVSVHVCEPADGIAEIAAVTRVDQRYRAIAARLEVVDGRWRCVRLQLG